jgi:hypothetical protein
MIHSDAIIFPQIVQELPPYHQYWQLSAGRKKVVNPDLGRAPDLLIDYRGFICRVVQISK